MYIFPQSMTSYQMIRLEMTEILSKGRKTLTHPSYQMTND